MTSSRETVLNRIRAALKDVPPTEKPDDVAVVRSYLHVDQSPEQERLEAWIMSEVEKGTPLPGLYPPNEANKARYEASKKA